MDDAAPIEEFCRAVSPRLLGALVLQCDDRQVAEDIAQEALARAWERWDTVRQMGSPEGWVFRVGFNLALSWRRRIAVARRSEPLLAARDRVDGPDSALRVDLARALRSLPARQRSAVVCRYYADLSVSETAEVLGCAEGTVRSLCHQGLDRLRAVYEMSEGRSDA